MLIYSKQIFCHIEEDIFFSNIEAIDENIIQQITSTLNNAKNCFDPEKCVNTFLNEMANFDDLARFKGISAFCIISKKSLDWKLIIQLQHVFTRVLTKC